MSLSTKLWAANDWSLAECETPLDWSLAECETPLDFHVKIVFDCTDSVFLYTAQILYIYGVSSSSSSSSYIISYPTSNMIALLEYLSW